MERTIRIVFVICGMILAMTGTVGLSAYGISEYSAERAYRQLRTVYAGDAEKKTEASGTDGGAMLNISSPGTSLADMPFEDPLSGPADRLADLGALKALNPDFAAWIKIESTPIDHPVMLSEPEDKYLRADYKGKYSFQGCLFMDSLLNGQDDRIVIYGHNMRSGTMFGCLDKYYDEDFYESHKNILFQDVKGLRKYRVAAIVSEGVKKTEKRLPPDYESLTGLIENSGKMYESIRREDRLLILCTCEYTHKNGRLYIIAREIREKNYSSDTSSVSFFIREGEQRECVKG